MLGSPCNAVAGNAMDWSGEASHTARLRARSSEAGNGNTMLAPEGIAWVRNAVAMAGFSHCLLSREGRSKARLSCATKARGWRGEFWMGNITRRVAGSFGIGANGNGRLRHGLQRIAEDGIGEDWPGYSHRAVSAAWKCVAESKGWNGQASAGMGVQRINHRLVTGSFVDGNSVEGFGENGIATVSPGVQRLNITRLISAKLLAEEMTGCERLGAEGSAQESNATITPRKTGEDL